MSRFTVLCHGLLAFAILFQEAVASAADVRGFQCGRAECKKRQPGDDASLLQQSSVHVSQLRHAQGAISQDEHRSERDEKAHVGNPLNLPITFITIRDPFFEHNLGASLLWKERSALPHQWILLDNSKNQSVSSLYAAAYPRAQHDLLVHLHSDVLLPDDFYHNFIRKFANISAIDPEWGVLGTAGILADWNGTGPRRVKTSISSMNGTFHSGEDNMVMQSFDEAFLVIRRGSSIMFDPQLPGLDLYGTDIVLSARHTGRQAYLLNLHIRHKTIDIDGRDYDTNKFLAKFHDPAYKDRARVTQDYLTNKWCGFHLLPVYGCGFHVEDCKL